ncbi:hypothetical protein [Nocardia brasiliensis]|uniref:hypothetical protein n=1 Tax=Nocardia brasiliensis TaxID=37326 RepID=UPI0018934532|nr:hypothetical protein [Nocardia brasiliensis]MBF6543308.1 hypothetical protein [Nocardia brasiliensis]
MSEHAAVLSISRRRTAGAVLRAGEFNAAVQAVADDRPLRGLEVDLFDVLEQ